MRIHYGFLLRTPLVVLYQKSPLHCRSIVLDFLLLFYTMRKFLWLTDNHTINHWSFWITIWDNPFTMNVTDGPHCYALGYMYIWALWCGGVWPHEHWVGSSAIYHQSRLHIYHKITSSPGLLRKRKGLVHTVCVCIKISSVKVLVSWFNMWTESRFEATSSGVSKILQPQNWI